MGYGLAERTILQRLQNDPEMLERFSRAFPDDADPIRTDNLIRAIACYERTLISAGSDYDRFVYLDETDALSPSARRGMDLFFSERTHCAECHAGFAFSGPVDFAGGRPGKESLHNTGVGSGTKRFRIPSLRSIALTAPYMHDGSLPTLESVIEHYAAGGVPGPARDSRVSGFELTLEEQRDLIRFLEALTDETRH